MGTNVRQARKVNFVNIPQELKLNAAFCVWKLKSGMESRRRFRMNRRMASWPEPMIHPPSRILEPP